MIFGALSVRLTLKKLLNTDKTQLQVIGVLHTAVQLFIFAPMFTKRRVIDFSVA